MPENETVKIDHPIFGNNTIVELELSGHSEYSDHHERWEDYTDSIEIISINGKEYRISVMNIVILLRQSVSKNSIFIIRNY